MSSKIQVLKPKFRVDECLNEIRGCLELGWTGVGFKTEEFESKWSEYTGLKNVIFQNSATASLHTALAVTKSALCWADGDEVLTTSLTFVSTNHAILYCKLQPIFVDIDGFLCMDPDDLQKKISKKTRAVIFVGLGGNTGQLERISEFCRANGLFLILDAAHMSGTKYKGKDPGHIVDVACYSFQAVKNLPTGDSGAVCFQDDTLHSLAKKFTWLGIDKDTYQRSAQERYLWDYEVEMLGYKYNGNSVMAALAIVGLKYLDQDNAYRRQLFAAYHSRLAGHDLVEVVQTAPHCLSSQHLVQVAVSNRDALIDYLNQFSIFPGVHYKDNQLYRMYGGFRSETPRTTLMNSRLLSLPCHLDVDFQQVEQISSHIIDFVKSN